MKFAELNLESRLLKNIENLGYKEATPIQEQAIPHIINGKDVAGLAQTGTGKTAAFVIPLIERILLGQKNPTELQGEEKERYEQRAFKDWKGNHFVMILVPTRELAEQVQENIQKLTVDTGLKAFAIYGGTGYDRQKEAFRNGLQFVVATPGRLIDLYKENVIDLKQVRGVVFDEADRMFDMGFKDDMSYLLQRIPRERQFLVFSATLNFDVLNTAYQFGADPVEFNISRDQTKAENVRDEIFHVGDNEKPLHLLSVLKKYKPQQAIIFTNFKVNVERIAQFLTENELPAMAISSLITQAQRTKVMQQFKAENHLNILVATDVAARGLDIKGVDLVINYELPMDCESYVHRIGRTGRAGSEGRAFSLVSDRDIDSLSRIEDYLKHKLTIGFLENQDLLTDFKPFPRYNSGSVKRSPHAQSEGGRDRRPERSKNFRQREDRGPRSGGPKEPRSSDQDQHRNKRHANTNGKHPPTSRPAGEGSSKAPHAKAAHGAKSHAHKEQRHPKSAGSSHPRRDFKRQAPTLKKQTSMKQKVVGFFKSIIGK